MLKRSPKEVGEFLISNINLCNYLFVKNINYQQIFSHAFLSIIIVVVVYIMGFNHDD